jgi:hypothetical protein
MLSATPIKRQADQFFETVPAGFHRLRAGFFAKARKMDV